MPAHAVLRSRVPTARPRGSAAPRGPAFPSLVAPAFDFTWFALPGLVAAAWGFTLGFATRDEEPAEASLGLWILGVLLVDVAHVWASLYRTYLDPVARRCHAKRLLWTPIACLWFGTLLHLASAAWFWTVLAYVAIFHFIKQHTGFARLYARAGDESPQDARLAELVVWSSTLGPVLWWHAHLPTQFAWFRDGDLLPGMPLWLGTLALATQVPLWIAFLVRRGQLRARGHRNPMLTLMAVVPALNWNVGIVLFDDDRVFTITNVFAHGVPYLALVWIAGGKETVAAILGRSRVRIVPVVAAYYGLLAALAYGEEWLWDRALWHEHPGLFGHGQLSLVEDEALTAIVVAALTLPQATHYVLDRFIWRAGKDNPRLAEQLGLSRGSTA